MSTRKKPNKTKTVRCPQCGTELLEVTDRIRQLKEAAFKLRDQERIDHAVFLKAEDRESGIVDCVDCKRGFHVSGRQGVLDGEQVCPRCLPLRKIKELEDKLVEVEQRAQEAQKAAESYEKLYAGELYRKGKVELEFDNDRADGLRRSIGKDRTYTNRLMIGLLDDRDTLLHQLGHAQDDIKDLQAKMSNSKFNAEQGAKARERLWKR
jgi:uncharacterized Zn finger protein (UPF0148 family)